MIECHCMAKRKYSPAGSQAPSETISATPGSDGAGTQAESGEQGDRSVPFVELLCPFCFKIETGTGQRAEVRSYFRLLRFHANMESAVITSADLVLTSISRSNYIKRWTTRRAPVATSRWGRSRTLRCFRCSETKSWDLSRHPDKSLRRLGMLRSRFLRAAAQAVPLISSAAAERTSTTSSRGTGRAGTSSESLTTTPTRRY